MNIKSMMHHGKKEKKDFGPRINYHIKISEVRVLQDKNQLGIMPTEKARQLAFDQGLDLVELVPNARPPVCHIMDYSKYRYEQKIKNREQAKKQRESLVKYKEIRLGPATADHDIQVKANYAKSFIEEGNKVQLNIKFKNRRELSLKEQGIAVFNKFVSMVESFAEPEDKAKFEGKSLICRFGPKTAKLGD